MNNIEKLNGLLEKELLTEEEKEALKNILEQDLEAKKHYDYYNKLKQTVKKNVHIPIDELASYVLYLNTGESFKGNIVGIEDHLRSCQICSGEFKLLNEEFSEAENYVSAIPSLKDSISTGTAVQRKSISFFSYSSAAILLLGFVYVVLYFLSPNLTSPYSHLASLKTSEEVYLTRGRGTDYFQESIKALDDDNYSEAITYLEKDIDQNKNDETIFYSHYILGLAHLEAAHQSFIGLFPSYDREHAHAAVENLFEAMGKNTTGKFDNITLDAYFYLGKAFLMLEEKENAELYFSKVVENKGSKMEQAREILDELE